MTAAVLEIGRAHVCTPVTWPSRCPPLFPYTTLFRSGIGGHRPAGLPDVLTDRQPQAPAAQLEDHRGLPGPEHPILVEHPVGGQVVLEVGVGDLPVPDDGGRVGDRKSTRLHSSHVAISLSSTLSLHDALPIWHRWPPARRAARCPHRSPAPGAGCAARGPPGTARAGTPDTR